MTFHEKIMNKCLNLAKKGLNKTFPNPMVGCIILCEKKKIIGKGYHKFFGSDHAEVNAINSVKEKKLLKKATLYVNLEPCFHFGKTPPCVDLILKNGIKKVIIGTKDPNKKVNGKSIEKLEKQCEVIVGVLEENCRKINNKFFINQIYERPYIILKWSQTKDFFINNENYKNGIQKISCPESQILTHKWRSEIDAIMIGKNTALFDNPKLTVRKTKGKNPIRIVIDKNNSLPKTLNVFNKDSKTLILTYKKLETDNSNLTFLKIEEDDLLHSMKKIQNKGINSILIEGGRILLNSFLKENLWDEVRVFISKKENKKGIKSPDFLIPKDNKKIKIGIDDLYTIKNKNIIF
mgnify:FL=1